MNATLPVSTWNSPYSVVAQVIIWFAVILISLETIIGNAMVIMAYKIERNISKQVSNRYIVSLAISDLIIGIEGFPFFTVYVLNGERWPLGGIACETWLFLDYTLCLVSILTVLLITADRYLSVCHTAKYLKWQSPTKTQVLIVLSWLIPAVIFGIMIYGWSGMTGEAESMMGTECSAPFLSNPYVNMGMYVAYYWTTLVAMLILYKGIHQAAKNLEVKAKAKERRHIALILSQRLGTQVGVSLMLQSRAEKERAEEEKSQKEQKDSGYQTTTTATGNGTESEQNLCVIEEEKSGMMSRRESAEHFAIVPHPSEANSRRESEMEKISLLSHTCDSPVRRVRTSLKSLKSNDSRISLGDSYQRECGEHGSLKKIDSSNDSDTTSVITKQNSKFRKQKRQSRSSRRSEQGTPRRIAKMRGSVKEDREDTESALLQDDKPQAVEVQIRRSDMWVVSMRRRIANAVARRKSTRTAIIKEERSSSTDSSSSSNENESSSKTKEKRSVPQVTVTEQPDADAGSSNRLAPEVPKSETFLSASGVSRKISSLSTSLTREKVISSIFAPITVFNRRRKQTKAEKRAHKAFRTITFIVGCFAILWSPYYIMATVYGFCKGECIPSVIYTLSYYMCYLNSSGNPFAYALANRQFRSAFLRMMKGNFNKVA